MKTIFFLSLLGCILSAGNTFAQKDPIYASYFSGAVDGYDVVAYFTESKPVKGKKEFTYEWKDAKWYFSSPKNRDAFKASPEKYAPQYGGYCAWAVGHGYTASSDPEAWEIVNGKLYLNYNKKVQADWQKDKLNWIKQGDTNWPKVLEKQ